MTQKDYIALAAALKVLKPTYSSDMTPKEGGLSGVAYQQWCRDVMAVMQVCAADNGKFHRGEFLKALGVANIGVK